MKVTNTKTETTMYDTNGKKVSIVKKEILEVDTTPHLLNREESKKVTEKVTVYKTDLQNAQKIKEQLEKVKGCKKGQQIFRSMADLIMVVEKEKPLIEVYESNIGTKEHNITVHVTGHTPGPSVAHLIWEAANGVYKSDTCIKHKSSKKKK